MQKQLPIGIQDFPTLIEGDYLYVDKTEYYHRLISQGKYYFLSRPRRFGKSLFISTLKAIFEGRRDLFQGRWIHDKIDWRPRPVIHLDFSEIVSRETPLAESLHAEMDRLAAQFQLPVPQGNYDQKFRSLIEQLGAQHKVAILVDEYDKPIINFIDRLDQAQENREILKNFYSIIKGNDRHIAFFILTGVSKFSQVSIFSDLNNLNDISLDSAYAQMLGYTQAEIEHTFQSHINAIQSKDQGSSTDVLAQLREWYNGYSWDGETHVYNPFSVLNFLSKQRFQDYWFATGTPTFLMKLIRQAAYTAFDFENKRLLLQAFNTFDIPNIDIHSLLFQTGYLTIKQIDFNRQTVTLGFPNREVANAFSFHLLLEFAEKRQETTGSLLLQMNDCLQAGDHMGFVECINALFADIAYPIQPAKASGIANMEKYFHSLFYLALRLLGYDIQAEVLTHTGRIDAVITTRAYIYVIEFKIGDAAAAMAQLRERRYHIKYMASGKQVILLGMGFDLSKRLVGDHCAEAAEAS